MQSRKFEIKRRVALIHLVFLLLPTAIIYVLSLVGVFDDTDCEFDWCRYQDNIYNFDEFDALMARGTFMMHYIYESVSLNSKIQTGLINVSVVALLFYRANLSIREMLLLACVSFVPGKEFYLIVSAILLARYIIEKRYRDLIIGIALTAVVRPEYFVLFIGAYLFVMIKRRAVFYSFLLCVIVVSLFVLKRGVDAQVFEQESTLPFGEFLRSSTSGPGFLQSVSRTGLYFLYLLTLPFLDFYRLLITPEGYVKIYYLFTIGTWTALAYRVKRKHFLNLIFAASIITGCASPLVHMRYAFPCFVMLVLISLNKNEIQKQNFRRAL